MRNILLALITGVIAGEVLSVYLASTMRRPVYRARIEDDADDMLQPEPISIRYGEPERIG